MIFLRQFLFAFMFFTRLRVPFAPDMSGIRLAGCVWAFPLVGLVVGAVSAAVFLLTCQWGMPAMVAAWLAIAAQILLTGGLHEDGLADTADALAFNRSAEEKLAIMRDSRIGSFGVLALIITVGMRAAIIGSLAANFNAFCIIVIAAMMSRAAMAALMATTQQARQTGMAADAGSPPPLALLACCALPLPAVLFTGGVTAMLTAAAITCVATWWIRRLAIRQFGGITGDVLGATQQLTELALLITLLLL